MVKAMKHQLVSLRKLKPKTIAAAVRMLDFSDPGTGKTFVEIMAFAAARRPGDAMLVIAPKSLLDSAWGEDFKKFAPELRVSIARAENRAEAFAVLADVYVTNTDATVWLAKQPKKFFARFTRLVVDEATAFKHITSQRSKALNKIKKYFRDRIVMTGTPNPRSITDVWNQANIVDDGKRLGASFFAFRGVVCQPKQNGPSREMVTWEDKEGAEELVFSQIADITIRHRFQDCVDIPENFERSMSFNLSKKHAKVYAEMAMVQRAALDKKTVISAINAAAVRTKLLQIASGAVYEHSEAYHLIDPARYELVMDLVEERKHSLVFYLWKHQRDYMLIEAKKRGIKFAILESSMSAAKRNETVKDFQAGFYQVLFAHPLNAAHGLTLTRATCTIWPSPTDNLEWFRQGNKRIHRNGQKLKTETICIIANVPVEQKVYANLQKKDGRMTDFLALF